MGKISSLLLIGILLMSIGTAYAADGDVLWEREYNSGRWDYAHAITVDSFNNVIVTGKSQVAGSTYCYYTIKYSPNGTVLWEREYCEGTINRAFAVATDRFGNVIVTGLKKYAHTSRFYYTIKYSPNGNILWTREHDSGIDDAAYGVAVDSFNNIIVTGSANNNYYTIKYSPNGDVVWTREHDSGSTDEAYGVAVDSFNNIIVTGRSNNNYYTIKYGPNGNKIWGVEYNGGSHDYGQGVAVDSRNNVIVTGKTNVVGDGYHYYTIKYDPNGNVTWNARYDGGTTNRGHGVAVDSYDNVIVTGFSRLTGIGNIYTIKYDSSGKIIWENSKEMNHSFNIDHENEMNGIAVDSFNNVLVTGSVHNGQNWDYYTVKYEGIPSVDPPKETRTVVPEFKLFPGLDLQRLIIPTQPIPIDGSVAAIIDTGAVVEINRVEVPVLEIYEERSSMVIQVHNPGFLAQVDAGLRFDNLPKGVSIESEPKNKTIRANEVSNYFITINTSPEVISGEYEITMTSYARRGSTTKAILKLIIK